MAACKSVCEMSVTLAEPAKVAAANKREAIRVTIFFMAPQASKCRPFRKPGYSNRTSPVQVTALQVAWIPENHHDSHRILCGFAIQHQGFEMHVVDRRYRQVGQFGSWRTKDRELPGRARAVDGEC